MIEVGPDDRIHQASPLFHGAPQRRRSLMEGGSIHVAVTKIFEHASRDRPSQIAKEYRVWVARTMSLGQRQPHHG